MGGASRNLNYQPEWPVPEFVGLSVPQARALADETGVVLTDGATGAPPSAGRIARQDPHGTTPRRPQTVTVWLERDAPA